MRKRWYTYIQIGNDEYLYHHRQNLHGKTEANSQARSRSYAGKEKMTNRKNEEEVVHVHSDRKRRISLSSSPESSRENRSEFPSQVQELCGKGENDESQK